MVDYFGKAGDNAMRLKEKEETGVLCREKNVVCVALGAHLARH